MVSISVKKAILASLTLGLASFPFSAYAMPQGAHDVKNIDKIAQAAKVMDVEGHGNAVIKWKDFSVDADETVNFKGMSKMLNYVDQKNPSKISGAINAKGVDLYVINPSGVLFNDSSKVNVANLFVSSRAMTDATLNKFAKDGVNPLGTPVTAADIGRGGRKSEEILGAYDIADGDIALLGKVTADTMTIEGNVVQLKNTQDYTDGDGNLLKGDAVKLVSDNPVEVGYEVEDTTDGSNKYLAAQANTQQKNSASSLGYATKKLDGTRGALRDAWLIESPDDFKQIKDDGNNAIHALFFLSNDIDFNGASINGIDQYAKAYDEIPFSSFVLNGLNHSIKNIETGYGLFGFFSDTGTVKNLRFENANGESILARYFDGNVKNINFISGKSTATTLCDWVETVYFHGENVTPSISNIENHIQIHGGDHTGSGIIGNISTGGQHIDLHNIVNYADITMQDATYCAGVAGYAAQPENSKWYNLANFGNIKNSGTYTSGIIAFQNSGNSLHFENLFNAGDIDSDYYNGGIFAELSTSADGIGAYINKAFNLGQISADNTMGSGGLIGFAQGQMFLENVYNSGNIKSFHGESVGWRQGGIIGYGDTVIHIKNGYNSGNVYAGGGIRDQKGLLQTDVVAGGIAGGYFADMELENVYNTGNVYGHSFSDNDYVKVGGLVGQSTGQIDIKNVYQIGTVNLESDVSPEHGEIHSLVGCLFRGGTINFKGNVKWKKQADDEASKSGRTRYEQGEKHIAGDGEVYYDEVKIRENDSDKALLFSQIDLDGIYDHFDIDKDGSNPDATWRIYEGHGLPLLTFAMRPATVQATTNRLYNGQTQVVPLSSIITLGDAKDRNRVLDPAHVFGYDLSGRNAGVYSQPMWSDQFGYNFQFVDPLDSSKANTAFLKIEAKPVTPPTEPSNPPVQPENPSQPRADFRMPPRMEIPHEDFGLNRGRYTGIADDIHELLPRKTETVEQNVDVEEREDNLVDTTKKRKGDSEQSAS